jgi:hypothetical protein
MVDIQTPPGPSSGMEIEVASRQESQPRESTDLPENPDKYLDMEMVDASENVREEPLMPGLVGQNTVPGQVRGVKRKRQEKQYEFLRQEAGKEVKLNRSRKGLRTRITRSKK